MKTLRAAATGGALVLAFALTACSDDTTTPASEAAPTASSSTAESAPASDEHNDADVTFAQGMIAHHRGAIAMADLTVERAQNPEVQALAERISDAQGPEIETMTSWLKSWGEDVPEGMSMAGMDSGGMAGMDHGDMSATEGTDMEASMAELEGATAADFDRGFLEMMIEHHQGAVQMAQTEQADGQNPEALELASTIEADQTQEIEEMQQLLQRL